MMRMGVALVAATLGSLVGCGGDPSERYEPNTDPRVGWVNMGEGTSWRCVGNDRVIRVVEPGTYGDSTSTTVIEDAEECE